MKKLLTLILTSLMVLSLVGCSSTKKIETINVTVLPTLLRVGEDSGYLCDEDGQELCISFSDDNATIFDYAEEGSVLQADDGTLYMLAHLTPKEGYAFAEGFTIDNTDVMSFFVSDDETKNIPVDKEDLETAQSYFPDAKVGDVVLYWEIEQYKSEYVTSHEDVYYTDYEGEEEYLYLSVDIDHNEDGLITKVTGKELLDEYTDHDNFDDYYSEYYYDDNGNEIKNVRTYTIGTDYSCTSEYEYDESNRLVKCTYTYGDGTVSITTREYEDDNHYTSRTYDDELSDDNLASTYVYVVTLDDDGDVISKSWTNPEQPDVTYELVNEIDANDYCTKQVEYKNGEVVFTTTYTYDENDNCVEEYKVYDFDGNYWTQRTVSTFEELK